jgi:carbon storage regulator
MLILSRRIEEKIMIGDNICVTLKNIEGSRAWIGIDAPKEFPIYRHEVWEKNQLKRADGKPISETA